MLLRRKTAGEAPAAPPADWYANPAAVWATASLEIIAEVTTLGLQLGEVRITRDEHGDFHGELVRAVPVEHVRAANREWGKRRWRWDAAELDAVWASRGEA